MQTRRVGNSGLSVSVIGLGTLGWSSQIDQYVALEQLKAFYDAGGTLIDTSPVYAAGKSQALVGATIETSRVRSRFVLAARAGYAVRDGQRVLDVSRAGLLTQLDETLKELRTDYLDLWQLDRWDRSVPLAETLSALAFAVQSGRVRYVGVSNLPAWQMALAHATFASFNTGVNLVSSQQEYSLLNRKAEAELLPAVGQLQMSHFACGALGRGVLTGKYRSGIPADSRAAHPDWEAYVAAYLDEDHAHIVQALLRASEGLGVPASHVALAWLWRRPQVASAIVGARTVQQFTELLDAPDLELPEPISSALDDVSQEA